MAVRPIEISLAKGPSGSKDRIIRYNKKTPFGLSWKNNRKTIKWKCSHRFSIHISDPSPLEKNRYSGKGSITAKLKPKNKFEFHPGEHSRVVKYSVSVYDPKTDRIWTDDPSMIIEP